MRVGVSEGVATPVLVVVTVAVRVSVGVLVGSGVKVLVGGTSVAVAVLVGGTRVKVGVAVARGVFVGGRVRVAVTDGSGVLVALASVGVVTSAVGVGAQSRTAAHRISGAKICPMHAKSAMSMPSTVIKVWSVRKVFNFSLFPFDFLLPLHLFLHPLHQLLRA